MIASDSIDNSKQTLKTAKAVLELNSLFNDLNNFKEVPVVLKTILKKYIHIDWLGLYQASPNSSFAVITNNSLSFNWEKLYQTIACC
ncbi:MAG: hypothetical protein KAI40_09740 [Desulfobacterales bacterium]|nr:hypothetical protein [Desulfobacterales bacterium]